MASLKGKRLNLTSPAQNADPKGGPGGAKNSPSFGGKQGKGTKSHMALEGPNLTGGGWGSGKK